MIIRTKDNWDSTSQSLCDHSTLTDTTLYHTSAVSPNPLYVPSNTFTALVTALLLHISPPTMSTKSRHVKSNYPFQTRKKPSTKRAGTLSAKAFLLTWGDLPLQHVMYLQSKSSSDQWKSIQSNLGIVYIYSPVSCFPSSNSSTDVAKRSILTISTARCCIRQ